MYLSQSREWQERSLLGSQEGLKLLLRALFPVGGHPTPAKERPRVAFIRCFTQDFQAGLAVGQAQAALLELTGWGDTQQQPRGSGCGTEDPKGSQCELPDPSLWLHPFL